ncbi:MAG: EAL domain-containing protein [Methylococcaceae bacterium]|nr:EAL domain-containing protein [Methylococcaceae bacterium]
MSLSKQLLILISALFLILFSVNFALSVGNIKTYLEGESQTHAQDTATSLGLSLSPYMTNTSDPIIKTMASAIFDMGYYKEIRLEDANGKELIALNNEIKVEGVPGWFVGLLPMSPAVAQSEINSGWRMSGKVFVTVNSSFAYAKLYQQAKTSFYYSLTTFMISLALLVLVLRITLASLKRIDQMALEIADGHFETIESLPWTSEVRNVAASMNTMSRKIAMTIATLNNKLEEMGANLLRDDLTGLYKKTVFETDMMRLLMEHGAAYMMLIRVDSLPELVKEQGSEAIDSLLRGLAEKLRQVVEQQPETSTKAYRFYGGEFAVLVNTDSHKQVEAIANALSAGFAELGEKFAKTDLTHIGVARLNPVGTTESMLEAAQEAYEQARLIGANGYYLRTHDNFVRDISAWKALVFDCIDRASYSLEYVGQISSFQTGELIMEEVFTHVCDKQGQAVDIGPFISIAEKFGKIVDLDKGVIQKALSHIHAARVQHAIAVNLSTSAIKNAEFRLWLDRLIINNQAAAKQLVFSFSAYAVAKDVRAHVDFIRTLHQWGGRVMIKRFETQSLSPEVIKKLKPDFVRLAREIGEGVSQSRQKYEFVQAMQQMGGLLDLAVLAENVQADNDYQALIAAGIAGASR